MNTSNKTLIIAIVFAALAISGALVFMGLQMSNANKAPTPANPGFTQESIEKGIEAYIAKQRQAQEQTQKNQAEAQAAKAKNVPPLNANDHIRGNKNAQISLIEYSDFECPYCKSFHSTAQELVDKYPDKVNWVYRHFPLGFHDPLATKQAVASECANELGGNEKFWQYADKLYKTTKSNGRGMEEQQLVNIAGEIGLNRDKFIACQKDEKHLQRVVKDINDGQASGVTGTPGNILINNKNGEVKFLPGAYPLQAFEQAMNELLN